MVEPWLTPPNSWNLGHLQALLEVPQVQRGQGPVGEASRVGGQLKGLAGSLVLGVMVTMTYKPSKHNYGLW